MIASLKGIIDALSQDSMIVNVNGVGFKVGVPTSVLSELGIVGGEVKTLHPICMSEKMI